jgi:hypothetical protein
MLLVFTLRKQMLNTSIFSQPSRLVVSPSFRERLPYQGIGQTLQMVPTITRMVSMMARVTGTPWGTPTVERVRARVRAHTKLWTRLLQNVCPTPNYRIRWR